MSKNKNSNQADSDFKEQGVKYILNKYEYDLYHEEDDKNEKVIRVKRFNLPNNGERWKIFENTKVMMIIEGIKLNKSEKDFLRTAAGFNFLIKKYKEGIDSFNSLKKEIKSNLK